MTASICTPWPTKVRVQRVQRLVDLNARARARSHTRTCIRTRAPACMPHPNMRAYAGPHGRLKSTCKECGGSSICPHGRLKQCCKECGGSKICTKRAPHARTLIRTAPHRTAPLCTARPQGRVPTRDFSKRGPIARCHNYFGRTTQTAGRGAPMQSMCTAGPHQRLKQYCKECGGSRICMAPPPPPPRARACARTRLCTQARTDGRRAHARIAAVAPTPIDSLLTARPVRAFDFFSLFPFWSQGPDRIGPTTWPEKR